MNSAGRFNSYIFGESSKYKASQEQFSSVGDFIYMSKAMRGYNGCHQVWSLWSSAFSSLEKMNLL